MPTVSKYIDYFFRFRALERQRRLFGGPAVRLAGTAAAAAVLVLLLRGRVARVHLAGEGSHASTALAGPAARPPPAAAFPAHTEVNNVETGTSRSRSVLLPFTESFGPIVTAERALFARVVRRRRVVQIVALIVFAARVFPMRRLRLRLLAALLGLLHSLERLHDRLHLALFSRLNEQTTQCVIPSE